MLIARVASATLAVAGMAGMAGMAGCGGPEVEPRANGAPAGTTRPGGVGSPEVDPPAARRRIPLHRALGQRLVTGYHGPRPTRSVLRAVRTGRVGGVILFEDNVPSPAVARSATLELHRAAAAGHQPPLLVLVDQEGGSVRRLKQLPPTRSPPQIGVGKASRRVAETQGRMTGLALHRLGINIDLAPVADVPASTSSFLRKRAFSRSPDVVARLACGFAAGLRKERVAAALKHFPGLGRASHNTDFAPVTVRASAAALVADLAPYARCARGVSLVMVSSASYPALDIRRPAVLVRRTYRLLALTGFRGLTISDALDTPAIATQRRPLLSAVAAGADLLLFGQDERRARRALSRLVVAARSRRLPRAPLQRTAERILAFKRSLAGTPGDGPPTGRQGY